MRGCLTIPLAALVLGLLYVVWIWLNSGCCDAAAVASTGRCLILSAVGVFLVAAAIIISEPKRGEL